MSLRPFFSFYGGKWRIARRYPEPRHAVLVEPFAGSAGYALRHWRRDVLLVERDPVIAAVWRFLMTATPLEVLAMPDLPPSGVVAELELEKRGWPPGAAHLVGFWCQRGGTSPNRKLSAWGRGGRYARQFWGPAARERIASQVQAIRHWRLLEGDYSSAPDIVADWFVDAPYQVAGSHYRFGSERLDFEHLGAWCRSRRGQVIVCENEGADWLPFEPFVDAKSRRAGRRSQEVVCLST